MRQHPVDVIGLQGTIKQDFSMPELWGLEQGGQFAWNWLPVVVGTIKQDFSMPELWERQV
jgi:hypothetical protein